MSGIKSIEGEFSVDKARFCLIASRFNAFIVEHLVNGAVDTLMRHGVDETEIDLVWVPGAYEMPLIAEVVANKRNTDAIIALGCVIRGATPHFEYVAGECSKGLAQVSQNHGLPVAFGVLTTDTIEQAIERAGTKAGNKGSDAAMTALEMVSLIRALGK